MDTIVSDTFPLNKLECQYFEICRGYCPERCKYGEPCKAYAYLNYDDKKIQMSLRSILRTTIEGFVSNENLEFQVDLISKGKD